MAPRAKGGVNDSRSSLREEVDLRGKLRHKFQKNESILGSKNKKNIYI